MVEENIPLATTPHNGNVTLIGKDGTSLECSYATAHRMQRSMPHFYTIKY